MTTVREVFDLHYDRTGLSPATIKTHLYMVNRWERMTSNPPIETITTETINAYRKACATGNTNDSTETGITTIRVMLNVAERAGLIGRAPWTGKRLKRRRTPKYTPSLEDFGRLYAQAEAARWPRGMDCQRFWKVVLCLSYFTGLRLSDLFFELTWSAFRPDGIYFEASKTAKCHAYPRHPIVDRHLDLVRNWSETRVFPVGRSVKQIRRELHRMSAAAGIKKHITMQPIRRLSSTQWSAAKWPAGELIQGSAIKGSARVYIVPQLLQQAGPLLAWPPEMLLPEERDARKRDEVVMLERFRRLDDAGRQAVTALADRLAS